MAALNNSADSHLSIFLDAPIIPALFSRFVDLGCLHNDPLGLLRLWDFKKLDLVGILVHIKHRRLYEERIEWQKRLRC